MKFVTRIRGCYEIFQSWNAKWFWLERPYYWIKGCINTCIFSIKGGLRNLSLQLGDATKFVTRVRGATIFVTRFRGPKEFVTWVRGIQNFSLENPDSSPTLLLNIPLDLQYLLSVWTTNLYKSWSVFHIKVGGRWMSYFLYSGFKKGHFCIWGSQKYCFL